MDSALVTQTWIFDGLSDLYFAFECEDPIFEYQERFSEIMGLEKFLKAALLFHHSSEYESLSKSEAKERIKKLAMSWGHDFKRMLKLLLELGVEDISRIKDRDFDGYLGRDLVRAVKAGYLETRYPVPRQISDTFPIKDTEFTHNPLGSSGITKFIYALCNACFFHLMPNVETIKVVTEFDTRFRHREPFHRFNNLFWESRCVATSNK